MKEEVINIDGSKYNYRVSVDETPNEEAVIVNFKLQDHNDEQIKPYLSDNDFREKLADQIKSRALEYAISINPNAYFKGKIIDLGYQWAGQFFYNE